MIEYWDFYLEGYDAPYGGRLARMVLDCCPTAKCTNPARDCYGSGCLSDEPQSAVAAAYGGLTQTPQG